MTKRFKQSGAILLGPAEVLAQSSDKAEQHLTSISINKTTERCNSKLLKSKIDYSEVLGLSCEFLYDIEVQNLHSLTV